MRTHHHLFGGDPHPTNRSSQYEEPPTEEVVARHVSLFIKGLPEQYTLSSWIRKLLVYPENNTRRDVPSSPSTSWKSRNIHLSCHHRLFGSHGIMKHYCLLYVLFFCPSPKRFIVCAKGYYLRSAWIQAVRLWARWYTMRVASSFHLQPKKKKMCWTTKSVF